MGIWLYIRGENVMRNMKMKIIISMISTTLLLFLLTLFFINYYQKNYIIDKAMDSLENEVYLFTGIESMDYMDMENNDRFFGVQVLFVDELMYDDENVNQSNDGLYEYEYFTKEEKYFKKLYQSGELPLNEIKKINNNFGEYYVLLAKIPYEIMSEEMEQDIFNDNEMLFDVEEDDDSNYISNENSSQSTLAIFYTDITFSANIINRLNYVFFIMLLIAVIIEGMVGIYLGTKFELSQRKLKHFFQNASHELKTPLMSIQGYAEGIKNGMIDIQSASDVIINQSNKMKLLVDEILNISKLDSGEYILSENIIDIRDIIEDSLEQFTQLSVAKNIEIAIDFDEEHSHVIGDELQIYKAINTVIDNAFKFAISEVKIATYSLRQDVCIDIYNDGHRLEQTHMEHIFDRFYSSDNISTGIGLAMAKQILVLSKGDIGVCNKGDGVMFQIRLPKKVMD